MLKKNVSKQKKVNNIDYVVEEKIIPREKKCSKDWSSTQICKPFAKNSFEVGLTGLHTNRFSVQFEVVNGIAVAHRHVHPDVLEEDLQTFDHLPFKIVEIFNSDNAVEYPLYVTNVLFPRTLRRENKSGIRKKFRDKNRSVSKIIFYIIIA